MIAIFALNSAISWVKGKLTESAFNIINSIIRCAFGIITSFRESLSDFNAYKNGENTYFMQQRNEGLGCTCK